MTDEEAEVFVFVKAFRGLKKRQRERVLYEILTDKRLRQDLMDAFLIEERRQEPERDFEEFLREEERRRGR